MVKRIIFLIVFLLLGFLVYFVWKNIEPGPDPLIELKSIPDVDISDSLPKWWQSTTVYQIYPRSFKDSDNDGIGDIAGIISKLDYIKNLGFETIWFSPFFSSPQNDFGYDVSDYQAIAPEYGNMMLVDSLIQEIHARDMKIVLDLVLNHTSDEHAWFKESKSGKDNPKSDWYVWRNGKGDEPPNNWKNALGQGSGWTYVPERDQWYWAAFLPFQPDLNWRNPEVSAAMFDVVRFWLDKGVDGFRLDIFNHILEDPEFRDNPSTIRYLPTSDFQKFGFQNRIFNLNHPDNFELARELRAVIDEYDSIPRFVVGEVFGSHTTLRAFAGHQGDGLNLVFLFDMMEVEFTADFFRNQLEVYEGYYPAPLVPTYVYGNHDTFRSIHRLDNDPAKARLTALFQFTARGVPFTYNGEEIGMTYGDIPWEDAKDPITKLFLWMPDWMRTGFPVNRDNCRTPMQWNSQANAGFSGEGVTTWLPVLANYPDINVENQEGDPQSLLSYYQSLLELRNNYQELQQGDLSLMSGLPKNVLGFQREGKLSVFINFDEKEKRVKEQAADATVIFGTHDVHIDAEGTLSMPPISGVVIQSLGQY